jgi:CopG family nickel-responsive transcriptional regulator
LQRVTLTIDDDLMTALDLFMEAGGHLNRSEAVRDLVRAGLIKQSEASNPFDECAAALIYVYDHETRQLSKKLTHDHHEHANMSIAALHVHLDHSTCLEVSLLKGQRQDVEHFASHVFGERGVRYGQLVVVPSNEDVSDKL